MCIGLVHYLEESGAVPCIGCIYRFTAKKLVSNSQKDILSSFADSMGNDYQNKHAPKSKSWFDDVKDYAKKIFE